MKAEAINFWKAMSRCDELRAKVVCSESWIEAIIIKSGDNGRDFHYLPGIYPPRGSKTPMQTCPACKRICPQAGPKGSPCCDCQTEKEVEDFKNWSEHPQRRELWPDLKRRWWRSFLGYDPVRGWWYTTSACNYKGFMDNPTVGWLGGMGLGQYAEDLTKAEDGSAIYQDEDGGPVTSDERGPGGGIFDPFVTREIALRRLGWKAKKGIGRSAGCRLLLLTETKTSLKKDEPSLQKEIDYFHETGRVIPSARRYSRHTPYLPSPEDYDSQTAYAKDVDRDSDIDYEDVLGW